MIIEKPLKFWFARIYVFFRDVLHLEQCKRLWLSAIDSIGISLRFNEFRHDFLCQKISW
jgi:hypothetical protein